MDATQEVEAVLRDKNIALKAAAIELTAVKKQLREVSAPLAVVVPRRLP